MDIKKIIKEDLVNLLEKSAQSRTYASIYKEVADKYNVHPERIRKYHRILKELKNKKILSDEVIKKVNFEHGIFESTKESNFEPKNYKELAELHSIDLNEYVINSYWSKFKTNGKFSSSVLAKKKKSDDLNAEDVLNKLNSYTPKSLGLKKVIKNTGNPCCAFLDITDYHLDKRDIFETTIEQKVNKYFEIFDNLLRKATSSNNIEEIVFVIGSDMLHTDNIMNQTTKGTQQETTVRWNEAFDIAFDIYVESITKLKKSCDKLNVILVSGNHGRTKEYYLAYALKRYFEKEKNIKFDVSPNPRKVYIYGNTFIGLHHGNTKIESLPLVFAKEFTSEWGKCKYHEIKVGDKHHYMEKDYHGVRIKQLPALTNADTWHNDNNFVNSVQSAIISIYDKEKGRCMDIEER